MRSGPERRKCVSVVIPNWNGRGHLSKCLPALLSALDNYGAPCEVIVVDNGSVDGSVQFALATSPIVRTIALDENRGFSTACNIGAASAEAERILFLNNDTVPDIGFLRPLVERLDSDPLVFAVGSRLLFEGTGQVNFDRHQLAFVRGFPRLDQNISGAALPSAYASGACSLVRYSMFEDLGGFDDMFYYEDVDLCYRAWKRGWYTLVEPESRVLHVDRGTSTSLYSAPEILAIMKTAQIRFMWKNATDRWVLSQHLAWLPIWLLLSPFIRRRYLFRCVLANLLDLKSILALRAVERTKCYVGDRQVVTRLRLSRA